MHCAQVLGGILSIHGSSTKQTFDSLRLNKLEIQKITTKIGNSSRLANLVET